ncbi:MAG: transglycosylase SLT domain-containing protein [Bacteroidales bacterium]|jgi:membrane-bound lytic murein transglycosylase D|nr:transglycosylase SLT domain-containing protein [Bacteroidales bacterium]
MRILFSFFFVVGVILNVHGSNENKNNESSKESSAPDHASITHSLNTLYDSVNIWWQPVSNLPDSLKDIKIPVYPAYIYEKRIDNLNELTPIKLEYNEHVQKYIDAYGVRNREKLKSIISKSAYYFPIFEEYLDKYNLPLELKYLAAVESALDPTAISKSGAVGLWQFMKPTADIFGMKITSYIDERRDVYKSTDAACQYLKYLYQTFGDWQLALAAYNGGPGTLTKAIALSGGKTNYWELRPYLTDQMQNYVPAFIAMNYLMEYHSAHNIFPDSCFFEAVKADTIFVEGPLYLKNIAEITNSDLELIKSLNPTFKHSFIPKDGKKYPLVLPNNVMYSFIENKGKILESQSNSVDSVKIEYKNTANERTNYVFHTVVAGDTLFRLALNNECSIKDILRWNGLDEKYSLKAGDRLKIFVD